MMKKPVKTKKKASCGRMFNLSITLSEGSELPSVMTKGI